MKTLEANYVFIFATCLTVFSNQKDMLFCLSGKNASGKSTP